MHGFGAGAGSWASSAAEVAAAGGKSSLTGTIMHAAAHGVSAGSMTAATGGSFKDGFIGGAIGFGVGLPFGGAGGAIQGTGPGAIAARTAIAAIGGGVGSKLTGGSFADGAYSAAFFHLFNNELERLSATKEARRITYDRKSKLNGALDLDITEVWLEVDQMIDRLAAMKGEHPSKTLTWDHVQSGSDTAFALGPLDRPVGQVGTPIRIFAGKVLIAEVNSWELNYIGVGAAIQMKAGNLLPLYDHDRASVVRWWNVWNGYHQPMTAGKTVWATVGAHYAGYVWRNGGSLNRDVGARYEAFTKIVKRYVND